MKTCECGCGQPTNLITENDASQGLVKGTYRRFVRNHRYKSPVEYVVDERGCWVWQRAKASAGYGLMPVGEGIDYAHRVYYRNARGQIPEGMHLDHLCRNRACVNPDHLEPVPPHINSHRGIKTRLTAAIVVDIRTRVSQGERTEPICKQYGLSFTHVASICKGERWASAGGPIVTSMPKKGRRIATVTAAVQNEIRELRASGVKNVDVARRFGISPSYASQIATGALDD